MTAPIYLPELNQGNVPDRFQQSVFVVPGHPVEGGELDVFESAPGGHVRQVRHPELVGH